MSKDRARSDAATASEPKPVVKRDKRSISEIRKFKKDQRKNGLYVGSRLHLGQMG